MVTRLRPIPSWKSTQSPLLQLSCVAVAAAIGHYRVLSCVDVVLALPLLLSCGGYYFKLYHYEILCNTNYDDYCF